MSIESTKNDENIIEKLPSKSTNDISSDDSGYKRAPLEVLSDEFPSDKKMNRGTIEELSEDIAGEKQTETKDSRNYQNNRTNQQPITDNLLQKLLPAGIDPDTLLIGAMILLFLSEHGEVAEPDDDLLLLLGLLLFVGK